MTGKANQLARAAAIQVANNPGVSYNPLFFDGSLSAQTYERWLRDTGVQYVALPGGPLAFVGQAEGALVAAGS